MKKIFNIDLTWKKLIIFSIIIGIYTGLVALIPINDISIKDISISFEWWILFGIMIILNSKSPKDSAFKCFVFFLISQPLVYLVQVPFNSLGFGIFQFYVDWFKWTLCTIPMGYIGYYIKKDNFISLLILTPILLFLGAHTYLFMKEAIYHFPNHLLSTIFCIVSLFTYIYVIFNNKKVKKIGYIICILITLTCVILMFFSGTKSSSTYSTTIKCSNDELYFDDTYNAYLENSSYGELSIQELYGNYCIEANFIKEGKTKLVIEKEDIKHVLDITIGRNTYNIEG